VARPLIRARFRAPGNSRVKAKLEKSGSELRPHACETPRARKAIRSTSTAPTRPNHADLAIVFNGTVAPELVYDDHTRDKPPSLLITGERTSWLSYLSCFGP
jgi:hypothetical protein